MSTIMAKRGSLDNVVTFEHYCDTTEEIQNIPKEYSTLGSIAIAVNDEQEGLAVYICNSNKEWIPLVAGASIPSGGGGVSVHICGEREYDTKTGLPTVELPLENTIYFTPGGEGSGNLYNEYIYVDDDWELFGTSTISGNTAANWTAESNENGYIFNKPYIYTGGGTNSIIEHTLSNVITNGVAISHAEGSNNTITANVSHAEGQGNTINAVVSHAEGSGNTITSSASFSHTEGTNNVVSGVYTHAEGDHNTASAAGAHVEGIYNSAYGASSHAEGYGGENVNITVNSTNNISISVPKGAYTNAHTEGQYTAAAGIASHAEGNYNIAQGQYSHAEGTNNIVQNSGSHAEGSGNVIRVNYSHAEGAGNLVVPDISVQYATEGVHVEGSNNYAFGHGAHAEGVGIGHGNSQTIVIQDQNYSMISGAQGMGAHSEGYITGAAGAGAHSEGYYTYANAEAAHVEGRNNIATAPYTHIEGHENYVSGTATHAEGYYNIADNNYAHVEGYYNTNHAQYSHVEGGNNTNWASGQYGHVEGHENENSGLYTHAEGDSNIATPSVRSGHIEGANNTISAYYTHAEGYDNIASGQASHAEGNGTQAIGSFSHAEGDNTIAAGESQHVFGKYNEPHTYPNWTNNTQYEVGDKIVYNSTGYVALIANINSTPSNSNENWQQLRYNNDYVEIVGNGYYAENTYTRSNARTLSWEGDETLAGSLTVGTKIKIGNTVLTEQNLIDLLALLQS